LFVAIAAVALLLLAQAEVTAQQIFKPGERVLASPSYMEDEKYYYPCTVVKYDSSFPRYQLDCDGKEYYVTPQYVRAPKQTTAQDNSAKKISQNKQTPGNKGKWKAGDKLEVESRAVWYPAQIIAVDGSKYKVHYDGYSEGSDEWVEEARMRPVSEAKDTEANVTAECSFEPPAPKNSNSDPFSANLAKREIYDGYKLYANGTLSAPLKIGVQFLSFQVVSPYKNIVKNVPGVGAKRINDAAPPNATIYRVKSKHIVCEEYSNGVYRKQVTSDYDCFKNRDGEWVCGSGGDVPPKIIQLN
jgi:hypothetical protein